MINSKVIIGIPVKNDMNSLKETIKSIYNSTEFPFEIVLAESNSTDGSKEYCQYLSLVYPNVRHIETNVKTPLEAYNILFDIARKERKDLLLSQTDVIYNRMYKNDWLKILHDVAHRDNISISTTPNGGGISGPDYMDGLFWVGGWATYIPLKTIDILIGFDTNFPNGYGVDIDFSYRAYQIGQIAKINYYPEHHRMNERIHDNDVNSEEQKQQSAKYFRQKWKLGEFKEQKDEPIMIFKNTEDQNGIEVKDFIFNLTKSLDESITECGFELTTDDGKILNSPSPNKIKFRVKRKEE